MQFKMVANQTEASRLEQRTVIKFLMAQKCKPCEIYRRMHGVYWEAYFSQRIFSNGLNMGLPIQAWVDKSVHRVETYWLSGKEKVPGTAISKEGHADSFLRHEMTHYCWFPWKRCCCI